MSIPECVPLPGFEVEGDKPSEIVPLLSAPPTASPVIERKNPETNVILNSEDYKETISEKECPDEACVQSKVQKDVTNGGEEIKQLQQEDAILLHELPQTSPKYKQDEYNAAYFQMFQEEGGGDGPASCCADSDSDAATSAPVTPPCVRAARWAHSLRALLGDASGARAFRAFVVAETGSAASLDLWFALRGLADTPRTPDATRQLVMLIWKAFLRNGAVPLPVDTFALVESNLRSNAVDAAALEPARRFVERDLSDTLYRAFLESDLYHSFLWLTEHKDAANLLASYGTANAARPPLSQALPPLLEDSVVEVPDGRPRLTPSNLLASAGYRANMEQRKSPDSNHPGYYLKGRPSYHPNPYHVRYVSGHTVSLQDSELQSLSSGAHTDDTKSYTNSSVDANSMSLPPSASASRRHQRRHQQRIRENAMQNKETPLTSALSNVHVVPRTMLPSAPGVSAPRADTEPEEFAKLLCDKLHRSQQNLESRERLMQSMCKITHGESEPEQARREHAVNALPPNVLLNKLSQKVQLDDQDPCQSILDEHVARVWDSPGAAGSGGVSPRDTLRSLPPLAYPPSSHSVCSVTHARAAQKHASAAATSTLGCIEGAAAHFAKSASKGSLGYGTWRCSGPPPQSPARRTLPTPAGVMARPKPKSHHARRREAVRSGPDVYSTFSSDSGNVADFHDGFQSNYPRHLPPPRQIAPSAQHPQPSASGQSSNAGAKLPKSKSMPEYIENTSAIGACGLSTSESLGGSGSSLGRCMVVLGSYGSGGSVSGGLGSVAAQPVDCTDSGVSVVSDSGISHPQESKSTERIESWIFDSRPFTCGGNSRGGDSPTSVMSVLAVDGEEVSLLKEAKAKCEGAYGRGYARSTQNAGTTSPTMNRRNGGSGGRRSQCSSSASGTTCVPAAAPLRDPSPATHNYDPTASPATRDSPLGASDSHKNKSSSCSSWRSPGHSGSGSLPDGSSGSTASSSKEANKTNAQKASSSDVTTVVYSFPDDRVPFIIKVPCRPVTLRRFKQHLHKKGSYRYFFKKYCEDMGTVYEEITDDADVLPLFEGKIFVQIHKDN